MAWVEGILYSASDFRLKIDRWDFPDKGITCVFGESGSGKTTLLQIMAGLLPASIKLCVGGEMVSDLPPRERNIGFVFQDYGLFPHMTAFENLAFAGEAKRLPMEIWRTQADKLISKLGLEGARHKNVTLLSGGEQQRVALTRALLSKPRIVFLDEPFSSLDEMRRNEARLLVKELAEEFQVPFIFVTHDLRDVRFLSQSLLFLQSGEVLGSGETSKLLSQPSTLKLAHAIPENQIVEVKTEGQTVTLAGERFSVKKTFSHEGKGDHLLLKDWSLSAVASQSPSSASPRLRGEVLSIIDEGPHQVLIVRLSSGQNIRAVAPLNLSPKGQVELSLDLESLVLYKGKLEV